MKNIFSKYFTFNEGNNYQPLQTSRLIMGIFALLLIFNIGLNTLNCYLIKQNSMTASLNTLNIITEINKIRAANGLPLLIENPKLNVAALLKAQDMIENDYFSHYSPTGKAPWDWFSAAKYNYKYAGENLALNFWNDQEAVQAWLDSPTHKENILNPNYKETGLAILSGTTSTTKENRTVVVQMFGSEKNAATIQPKIIVKVTPPTTRATKPMLSTTTIKKIIVTTTTTTKSIPIPEIAVVNSTIDTSPVAVKTNDKTLLTNVGPVILQQSQSKNQSLSLGVNMVHETIKPKVTASINNGFGMGLLFIGIFGIMNINSNDKISNIFKKTLLAKNALLLLIGLTFLLNNFGYLLLKIKVPAI